MTVQAMGYFWVGTSKLDDWSSLAIGQLGLQAVDRGGNMRAFRMDDRNQPAIRRTRCGKRKGRPSSAALIATALLSFSI